MKGLWSLRTWISDWGSKNFLLTNVKINRKRVYLQVLKGQWKSSGVVVDVLLGCSQWRWPTQLAVKETWPMGSGRAEPAGLLLRFWQNSCVHMSCTLWNIWSVIFLKPWFGKHDFFFHLDSVTGHPRLSYISHTPSLLQESPGSSTCIHFCLSLFSMLFH
jgi:hypothetical protein